MFKLKYIVKTDYLSIDLKYVKRSYAASFPFPILCQVMRCLAFLKNLLTIKNLIKKPV